MRYEIDNLVSVVYVKLSCDAIRVQCYVFDIPNTRRDTSTCVSTSSKGKLFSLKCSQLAMYSVNTYEFLPNSTKLS